MSEITKLYENAGIKGEWRDYRVKNGKVYDGKNPKNRNIRLCKPRFTAEKQLKLIEFFISSVWWENLEILYKTLDCSLNFEDKLAKMVNYLWLSLSEEEKQQVKGILE